MTRFGKLPNVAAATADDHCCPKIVPEGVVEKLSRDPLCNDLEELKTEMWECYRIKSSNKKLRVFGDGWHTFRYGIEQVAPKDIEFEKEQFAPNTKELTGKQPRSTHDLLVAYTVGRNKEQRATSGKGQRGFVELTAAEVTQLTDDASLMP